MKKETAEIYINKYEQEANKYRVHHEAAFAMYQALIPYEMSTKHGLPCFPDYNPEGCELAEKVHTLQHEYEDAARVLELFVWMLLIHYFPDSERLPF